MNVIFNIVLTSTLYASVVGLIILLLKAILKNRLDPRWQYIIWLVFILKLIVPFGPKSNISLFNIVPKMTTPVSFMQKYESLREPNNLNNLEIQDMNQTEVDKTPSLAAPSVIPFIWLLGVISMTLWLLYTRYLLYKKIKKHNFSLPQELVLILEDCKNKFKIKKDIQIIIQDTVTTPAIVGALNPKILISKDTLELSDQYIFYIIMHELSHYKRKDLFTNYILLILQTIHWFNPVMWYCFKKIRQDMEMATDERVLSTIGSCERKSYGKALIAVLENFSLPKLTPRLIGMVDNKKNIERRIKMIKMSEIFNRKRAINFAAGMLCVTVLCGGLLTNALTKPSTPKGKNVILKKNTVTAASASNSKSNKKVLTPGVTEHKSHNAKSKKNSITITTGSYSKSDNKVPLCKDYITKAGKTSYWIYYTKKSVNGKYVTAKQKITSSSPILIGNGKYTIYVDDVKSGKILIKKKAAK